MVLNCKTVISFRTYMLCDPLCQVTIDLVGLFGAKRFLVRTSPMESSSGKVGFYLNEVKRAGETVTHKSRKSNYGLSKGIYQ